MEFGQICSKTVDLAQKQHRIEVSEERLELANNDEKLLKDVITEDNTRAFVLGTTWKNLHSFVKSTTYSRQ